MTRTRRRDGWTLAIMFACFVAGAVVDEGLRRYGPPHPVEAAADVVLSRSSDRSPDRSPRDTGPPSAPAVAMTAAQPSAAAATSGSVPAPALRMPIDGLNVESMKGGFAEARTGHPHEAVDLLAPRGTPIHAVRDGTIAKLFFSKQGGNTIYQFDPDGHLCFYYAHLDRYAEGLRESLAVVKGDVIGYVGTSGNAPPNTPHLHFAVFQLNADRHWWQGQALDPYLVFTGQK
jgi:murein DD-endopeptidase MepM/ murein hydrolase activator NlpD